jgi:hypothetical protein
MNQEMLGDEAANGNIPTKDRSGALEQDWNYASALAIEEGGDQELLLQQAQCMPKGRLQPGMQGCYDQASGKIYTSHANEQAMANTAQVRRVSGLHRQ